MNYRGICLLIATACFAVAAIAFDQGKVVWPPLTFVCLGVAAYIASLIPWSRSPQV